MNETTKWLIKYFESKNPVVPEHYTSENYFELGLIDSFGIIELIDAIEKKFGVKFDNKQFMDRRFPTIQGLSEIINELKS